MTDPLAPSPGKPRAIVQNPDPKLRVVCDPIPDGYPLEQLFDELERAMRFPAGIGIAAPQIGENVRALVVRVPHGRGEVRHRIANPEIYWTNKGKLVQAWEGCLSFSEGKGFRALVPRHRQIKVRGLDEHGEPVQFGGRDILARVLQHEIDHLDGKLMIDTAVRIDDGKQRRGPQQKGKGIDIGI